MLASAPEVCLGALPSFPAAKKHYKNQCFRNITHLEGLKVLSAAQVGTYKIIKAVCYMGKFMERLKLTSTLGRAIPSCAHFGRLGMARPCPPRPVVPLAMFFCMDFVLLRTVGRKTNKLAKCQLASHTNKVESHPSLIYRDAIRNKTVRDVFEAQWPQQISN